MSWASAGEGKRGPLPPPLAGQNSMFFDENSIFFGVFRQIVCFCPFNLNFARNNIFFLIILIANVEWFLNLPESVHACFYHAAAEDPSTMSAFVNCQLTDGGEDCFRDVPAGSYCLNSALQENERRNKFLG